MNDVNQAQKLAEEFAKRLANPQRKKADMPNRRKDAQDASRADVNGITDREEGDLVGDEEKNCKRKR